MSKRSGFVGIIGMPNVGKSTLLNAIIGEKLAGISPKPQTTRGVIRGIHTQEDGQIIFLDTPGMHHARDPLGKWMLREISKTLESVDLLYMMVLPGKPKELEEQMLERVKKTGVPSILIVNQVDKFAKPEVLPVLDYYHQAYKFAEMIPISAKKEDGIPLLIEKTYQHLPECEPLYPEDQISDQQERLFVQEIIREKIFRTMKKELPYSTSVCIDEFKEKENNVYAIQATIVVDKSSHKKIMIGKGGENLKKIGRAARLDIEKFMNARVFLKLWVKSMPNWKKSPAALKQLGYQ